MWGLFTTFIFRNNRTGRLCGADICLKLCKVGEPQTSLRKNLDLPKLRSFVWRTRTLFFSATCGSNCAKLELEKEEGELEGRGGR